MRKLLNRKIIEQIGNARFATRSSRITTISCLTTGIRKEWEGRGGMTTQTTSKPFIGGAIRKKAQPELRIKVLGFWIRFFQREFHERLSHNAA
jgi:hypothetical protein